MVRHIILVSERIFLSGGLEGQKGKFPIFTYCCADDSYLTKVLESVQQISAGSCNTAAALSCGAAPVLVTDRLRLNETIPAFSVTRNTSVAPRCELSPEDNVGNVSLRVGERRTWTQHCFFFFTLLPFFRSLSQRHESFFFLCTQKASFPLTTMSVITSALPQ